MNKELVRSLLAMIVFVAVLIGLSCGGGTRNDDGEDADASSTSSADNPCSEANIDQRLAKLEARITKKIKDNSQLKEQFDNGRFKFNVRKVGNSYLEVLLEGKIGGKDDLKDLAGILKVFMKSKCVLRVVFVSPGTLPLTDPSARADGFEWMGCEYPLMACPNGECLSMCPGIGANTNANTNSYPNANSDLNTVNGSP